MVVTVAWAAVYAPSRVPETGLVYDGYKTYAVRRLELQHDAWSLMWAHPFAGVGPDRFAASSATLQRIPATKFDARWAHHDFLQFGAESGLPGFALLFALWLWGFARLRRRLASREGAVLAAIALCALGLQLCVEHVLHWPAVPAVCAALLGSAVAGRRARRKETAGA